MEYILKINILSYKASTYMVEYLGIKMADVIEGITKDEWMKMKDEAVSLIKVEDWKRLEKFNMCYAWYIWMNQGKMPTEWTFFYEDNISDFDPSTFKIGRKSSKRNMKYDATITSNIDNEKTNFRVKLSKFPGFDRNQDSCINFRASVEAICKEEGI